jgi:hypothetical protein
MDTAPGDRRSARPASLGAEVVVNDAHDTERPGTIVDSVSGEYLVRFGDGTERWLRLDGLKTRDGRPMSTPRRSTASNVRRAATVNLATPTPRNYSQEIQVGDIRDLHPAEEIHAPEQKETEAALFLDRAPPARQSAPDPDRQRTSGRYSYTGDSNRPPPSDRVSARAVETARKAATSPVPPPCPPGMPAPRHRAHRSDPPRSGAPARASGIDLHRDPVSLPQPEPNSELELERAGPHYDGARSDMSVEDKAAQPSQPASRPVEHPDDDPTDLCRHAGPGPLDHHQRRLHRGRGAAPLVAH